LWCILRRKQIKENDENEKKQYSRSMPEEDG